MSVASGISSLTDSKYGTLSKFGWLCAVIVNEAVSSTITAFAFIMKLMPVICPVMAFVVVGTMSIL